MGEQPNIILNAAAVEQAMNRKGVRSVNALSRRLGLHRNTLGPYLAGERALPEALDKMLAELELLPGDAFMLAKPAKQVPGLGVADFISQLQRAAPDCAIVLFGSRARKEEKRYSDYDIGVFRTTQISLDEFSKLLTLGLDWNEKQLTTVQLVNLTAAEPYFLKAIQHDLVFLAGGFKNWLSLLEASGLRLYE